MISMSLTGETTRAAASRNTLDNIQTTINLPEVSIIPQNSTFTAILRPVAGEKSIFEVDTLNPIANPFTYYDPQQQQLYISTLTIGNNTYKNVKMVLITPIQDPPRFQLVATEIDKTALKEVVATVETKPVLVDGDAADDPAIWVHPQNPALSTIIGTQKRGGLSVYDLSGHEIQYLPEGHMNNVDLRYHFPLGEEQISLVAVTDRSNDSIALYKVNPQSRLLENIAARVIFSQLPETIYGICMYHSRLSNQYYVFINDKNGGVEQWEVFDNGNQQVDAKIVRTFSVKSQVEGCVADDLLGYFYLSEEGVGIWKFNAEPHGGDEGHLIDTVANGLLTPDIEGLAIYYINETEGYLLVSNQGSSNFIVYDRAGNNSFLGRFRIIANNELKIDKVEDTDGIEVVNLPLNSNFPHGLFVTQDGDNAEPDENQNFKLVPWEQIADALDLKKDSFYMPQ
ncbi:MAG: phytase [Thioploca sp.]|nr:phytase [Thioploca sp.]